MGSIRIYIYFCLCTVVARWIVDEDGSRFNAATNHPAALRCKLVDIINLVVEELDEG